MALRFGLTRKRQKSPSGKWEQIPNAPYHMRRAVPPDVRHAFPTRWLMKSTGTADYARAERLAEGIWRGWDQAIAEARRFGPGPLADLPALLRAIDDWRATETMALKATSTVDVASRPLVRNLRTALGIPRGEMAIDIPTVITVGPEVGLSARQWALRFFEHRPELSSDPHPSASLTSLLRGRLQSMAADPSLWQDIEGFDRTLLQASQDAGLSLRVPISVMEQARPAFARAWLEVVQQEESSRSIAASILAAADAVARAPDQVIIAPGPTSYIPRADDRTVAELIETYQAEKAAKNGQAAADKAGAHIFRALKEVLGADKPVRSITRDDAIAVKKFLQMVPANASKLYPNVPLSEAIRLGERDGRARLSVGTVRSYVIAMSSLFNWAVKIRRLMDFNPAIGLAGPATITVQRRGFSPSELTQLFDSLKQFKGSAQPSRYWVPALCLGGARLGEICQLKTADVKIDDGVAYLDLSLFKDGIRSNDKRLKNRASERAAPIHPIVIGAGFLEFVAARKAAGDDRLFPELQFSELHGYGGKFSKWFGLHLTAIGLSDRTLVFHSLRHLFREQARNVGLTEEIADAIGGWTAKTTGRRYGRQHVATLDRELARIKFQGLSLI